LFIGLDVISGLECTTGIWLEGMPRLGLEGITGLELEETTGLEAIAWLDASKPKFLAFICW